MWMWLTRRRHGQSGKLNCSERLQIFVNVHTNDHVNFVVYAWMEMDIQSESGAVLKTHVVVWTFVQERGELSLMPWCAALVAFAHMHARPNRDSQVNRK